MRILLNCVVALLLGVETETSVAIVQACTKELSKTSLLLEMSYGSDCQDAHICFWLASAW